MGLGRVRVGGLRVGGLGLRFELGLKGVGVKVGEGEGEPDRSFPTMCGFGLPL